MGKALKTAGMIVGGAILIATGVGALAGLNVLAMGVASFTGALTVGQLGAISAGVAATGAMLEKPKSAGAAAPNEWTANPDQPTPFAFGRVVVAGKIVHRDEYGKDNKLQGIVSVYSGAGPIKGFVSFKAGDLPVSFVSNGGTAIGKYNRQMWRSWRLGNQPDTALSLPTGLDEGAVMPAWGAAHRLSGKACSLWTLQQDSKQSVYPGNAEPKPTDVIEGVYGYDPRYDSSYPGGFGPCRLNDRSTWRWIDDPIIGGLNWALGMKENGQVVGGVGASINGIDVPAFVECANISEANDWKVSAWPDTSEDVSVVLDQFLQAGGAVRARHAGKISCVSRGAARPSIVTITRRDTAGAIELNTGASQFDRLNTITPRFMSEAHGGKLTPADPVTFEAYRIEDGGKRGDKIDYRFVPNVTQAAQLAAYDILDAREPFSGTIPLKPHMRRLKRGDCFDIDEPGFLLDGVKCMVLGRSYDSSKGEVRIAFRSETDGKHDLALGKTTVLPEYPTLTPADPTLVSPPLPSDWVIVVRPPAPGGTQLPGFDLTGIVSNSTATAIIVEHGPTAEGPWTTAYQGPPTVTTIPIDGLQSGETYFIAIQYQRNQNYSERAVYGPFTAPVLTAGISDETLDKIIEDVSGQIDGDIAAGKKALDRSRDNALLILQNAKNALDGTLKEEKDRETQTGDLQNRLDIGFLIDPVAGTGIIRSEVKVQGLNETLVQVNARLVARDADNELQTAQVAIDAQAYTNQQLSIATANLVAAAQMVAAISAAVLSMEAYADNEIALATAGLVAVAQMNDAIAASSLALQSWTTGQISTATAGLATTVAMANAIAAADLALRSWTNGQISTATAGLAAVSQVDTKIDTATLQLQSWTSGQIGNATATLATKTELNGVSGTAGLALSAATTADGKINAAISLLTDVDGLITGLFSYNNGVTGTVNILSSVFNLYSTGSGAQTSYIDGVWYVLDPDLGTRTMWGKPFGGANKLQWWTGPNSVPIFGETKANAYVFISMTAPRIGGSDFPGGSALAATASPDLALGSAPGGGIVTSETVTINVTGPGAASAVVRWVKTEETGGTMDVYPSGKTAYFRGTVPPGGMIRALYLAVVSYGGLSVTVLVDVQLTDSN